jgi:hypothetical protein
MRRFAVGAIAFTLLLGGSPYALAEDLQSPEYTGADFQTLYEYAIANTLPNLDPPNGRYEITGNDELDSRIWELAFERGYVLRPTASGNLGSADGVTMQPQAAQAWRALKAEARNAGMGFIVSSAYRSPAAQRTQFLSKLGGKSDAAIDAALTWWSIPGTSKHHGGYALDFRYRSGTFGEFRSTKDYAWLQDGNFAIPMRHGLIPSYPDDAQSQGPNPEPWEFVWVGSGLIQCGTPQSLVSVPGPAAAIVFDIARCPGGMDPAQTPGWLLSLW